MLTIASPLSVSPGHLTSAVISATVRDASKGQNIPVAVKYTLSSSHVVCGSLHFRGDCCVDSLEINVMQYITS